MWSENKVTLWHYWHDGQAKGPFRDSEILSLFKAKKIGPDTLVSQEGSEDWVPLCVQAKKGYPVPMPEIVIRRLTEPAPDDKDTGWY